MSLVRQWAGARQALTKKSSDVNYGPGGGSAKGSTPIPGAGGAEFGRAIGSPIGPGCGFAAGPVGAVGAIGIDAGMSGSIEKITTRLIGRSVGPVGVDAIFRIVSMPPVISPRTEYLPLNSGIAESEMKN